MFTIQLDLIIHRAVMIFTGSQSSYVQIQNNSDLVFHLAMEEGPEGFGYAPELTLHPGRIAIMPLMNLVEGKEGKAEVSIPYTVTNIFTGPDTHLSVSLDIQVLFISEE